MVWDHRFGDIIHRSGTAVYTMGTDRITVDDGFAEHAYARTMRGSEEPDPGTFTVYLTGYAPLSRQIRLSGEGGSCRGGDRT